MNRLETFAFDTRYRYMWNPVSCLWGPGDFSAPHIDSGYGNNDNYASAGNYNSTAKVNPNASRSMVILLISYAWRITLLLPVRLEALKVFFRARPERTLEIAFGEPQMTSSTKR